MGGGESPQPAQSACRTAQQQRPQCIIAHKRGGKSPQPAQSAMWDRTVTATAGRQGTQAGRACQHSRRNWRCGTASHNSICGAQRHPAGGQVNTAGAIGNVGPHINSKRGAGGSQRAVLVVGVLSRGDKRGDGERKREVRNGPGGGY